MQQRCFRTHVPLLPLRACQLPPPSHALAVVQIRLLLCCRIRAPVRCGHAHLAADFSPLHLMASPPGRYAYLLRPGGLLYTITDVEDLGNWQVRTCTRLAAACCAA